MADPEEGRDTAAPRAPHAWGRAALVVALGFGIAFLGIRYADPTWWLSFVPYTSEVVVVVLWRRWRIPASDLALLATLAGLAIGTFSIVTGILNGLTDEPWAFPVEQAMLFHGVNPYAVSHVAVDPYLGTRTAGRLWELPLTVVLLVPRVPYGFQMLACWLALVVVLRGRAAAVLLAQPFVALLAANGFSDFLPLLLLTVAYVGVNGRTYRGAEVVALGVKQFANVVIAVRYAWRREWRNLAVISAITAAWALPFLLWNPHAFVCGAVEFDLPSTCPPNANLAGPHAFNPVSLNYWLWPLWLLAVGWAHLPERLRRLLRPLTGERVPAEEPGRMGRGGFEPPTSAL